MPVLMLPLNNPATLSELRTKHPRELLLTFAEHYGWLPLLLLRKTALSVYYANLIARGKPHKLALTAVERKLCNIVWAVLRSKKSLRSKHSKLVLNQKFFSVLCRTAFCRAVFT
jgi:hypothetical protein